MVKTCPICRLANPPEATFCDCGYSFSARQVDPHRTTAPTHRPPGVLASWFIGRVMGLGVLLMLGGFVCALVGIGERVPNWPVVGFGVAGMAMGGLLFLYLLRTANR